MPIELTFPYQVIPSDHRSDLDNRYVGSLYEKEGCEQYEYSLWRHRFTDCSVEVTLKSDRLGCLRSHSGQIVFPNLNSPNIDQNCPYIRIWHFFQFPKHLLRKIIDWHLFFSITPPFFNSGSSWSGWSRFVLLHSDHLFLENLDPSLIDSFFHRFIADISKVERGKPFCHSSIGPDPPFLENLDTLLIDLIFHRFIADIPKLMRVKLFTISVPDWCKFPPFHFRYFQVGAGEAVRHPAGEKHGHGR